MQAFRKKMSKEKQNKYYIFLKISEKIIPLLPYRVEKFDCLQPRKKMLKHLPKQHLKPHLLYSF